MKKIILLLSFILVALVGCASGGEAPTEQEGIVVEGQWVRPAFVEGGNGAAFMVIYNFTDTDDVLLSISSDVAGSVELHESMAMDMESEGDGDQDMESMGDVMGMRPLENIPIPAGGSATLEPGGMHVMLIGIDEVMHAGESVTLTLTFEHAGDITIEAEVREE